MSKKQVLYIGKFSEEFAEKDGVMTKDAEMFSVGTHRGVDYTEEDLQTLVDSFKVEDAIPVQLDHSHSARDTVGFIESASVKDGKLLGKLRIIDEYAQERIKKGLMNKLSVSFYLKDSEQGLKPHSIREVSLVAFPQVKTARLFSENGFFSDYEEDQNKGGNNMTEQKIDLADITAQITKQVEAQIHEQYSDLVKQVEALQGSDVKLKETQVDSKIEKFSADNKIVPAQTDALKRLLASFSDEQTLAFEEFMSNSQKVDFSEQGEFQGEDGEEDEKDSRSKEQKEFDEFYEQHTKQYGSKL